MKRGWPKAGAAAGCAVGLWLLATPVAHAEDGALAEARRIMETGGFRGGLAVHVGCGDGRLLTALRDAGATLVHGLDADADAVERARQRVRAAGRYGPVSVDPWKGPALPYIDNLVNLLVMEEPGGVPAEEVMRVLAPGGAACVRKDGQWTATVKPRPADIDEWTHYLYDATNNAVARDARVGPPRRLQWVCGPAWSRHHDHMASLSALVSAAGRVFYIMDDGPRESILLPSKWSLAARDAFNGALLWKRPIAEWNTQLWPLKSGPNQLPRRLVAVGDRVFVTLGINAPVSVLDAATGKTVLTAQGTEHTDEIIAADGVLYLLVGQGPNKWKEYRPKSTYVWANTQRANSEWAWDRAPRRLMAVRADTGAVVWEKEYRVAPLTLGADAGGLYFYDGEKAVCLDRATGDEQWASEPVLRKLPFPTGYGPTLVVHQGVVLLSVENKSMTAFAAADGKTLWTAPHHRGGHMSPDDMLVVGGLVWSGAIAAGADSGVFTGRDIRTGEVKREFPPDVHPPWFHHRCYRSRATERYFIASRTGIELIDLEAKRWDFNHWVRGGCLYGFMPANGLIYAPPHSCGCFLESKLFGFNALAADRTAEGGGQRAEAPPRLEPGPAYGQAPHPSSLTPHPSEDWPTYRADAARSGAVRTAVPTDLKRCWQAELGGRLSSVVAAGEMVFVAAVDAHTVYALDAASGNVAWSFTAGARVDSPPTVHEGRVVFGSADGWVYCLRADDGRLAWRFRAAPADRRLTAYEQLESAWPVSGSVLVAGGTVYCVAGRSAFLDGGMRLVRLDPATGRLLSETLIDDRVPETGEDLQAKMRGQDMPVALPDVLSCDGVSVYMRSQAFDLEGNRRHVAPVKLDRALRRGAAPAAKDDEDLSGVQDHLFSRSGFLDDSWFWRSYWTYGKGVDSNYGGWLQPAHYTPSGRLMVFDETCVYGFARKPEYVCNASVAEYYLYGAEREVREESIQRVRAATGRINAASPDRSASTSDWAVRKRFPLTDQNPAGFRWAAGGPPIQARAMVLAGKTLFVAGPPDVLDEEEAFRNPDDPAVRARLEEQSLALAGARGGKLLALSAADGKVLSAWELGAMPTFDGLAAARGRLYLTTVDGKVLCLGAEGAPLAEARDVDLVPLDVSIKPPPPEPAPKDGPSLAGDFAKVVGARVTRSELGYRLRADGKTGLALRTLPSSLAGRVELKARLQCAPGGKLKNGFLVFGDSAEEAGLVRCGLRFLMGKAVIVQGPVSSGKTADAEIELDENKVYEVRVSVDLGSGQVTMKVGDATVSAKLDRPRAGISHVGYEVLNAATDFGPIETAGQPAAKE